MLKKDEALAKINGVEDGEFIVRTSEEETAFLENFENDRIGKRIGEVHGQYDKDILEVSGVERKQGEKTYDYNKRVIREFKEKADSRSDDKLTARITELETQLETASNAKEVKALMDKIKELNDNHQTELSSYQTKLQQKDVEFSVRGGLVGLEFSDLIPESVRSTFIERAILETTKKGKVIDGKVVYVNEEGEILRNKETMAPLTSQDILKDSLKDVLKESRKVTGNGTPPKVPQEKDGVVELSMEGIKTRDDITKAMQQAGIPYGSDKWDKTYMEMRSKLPK